MYKQSGVKMKNKDKYSEYIGQKFGMLSVKSISHINKLKKVCVDVECECGTIKNMVLSNLKSGCSKSCGCTVHHGGKGTKLYLIWRAMISRCEHESNKRYLDYGGRGIFICPEWRNSFPAFRDWANDNNYKEGLSIERTNNDDGYYPGNCKWIEMSLQVRNRRNNVFIEFNGESRLAADWAKIYGITRNTLYSRLFVQKLSFEEAINLPNISEGKNSK